MQLHVTFKANTNLFVIIYLLLGDTLLFLQITLFHRICYTCGLSLDFRGRIGKATTFASAKVKNAIGRIGIFALGFISP